MLIAPSIAEVKIGDMVFNSHGDKMIQPGEYAVEVSADGFETKTGRLVAKADETVELNLYLEPNTDATLNWYDEHAEDALVVGEIQNAEMMKKTAELLKKQPVLSKLPLTVEYFSDNYANYIKYIISYTLDDSKAGFHLIMKDYTGEGVGAAIKKLNELGMDTVGLEFEYENLENQTLRAKAK